MCLFARLFCETTNGIQWTLLLSVWFKIYLGHLILAPDHQLLPWQINICLL